MPAAQAPESPSSWSGVIHRGLAAHLGAELRSLAALRIALALCVLGTLASVIPDIDAFYTDNGLLPRSVVIEQSSNPYQFSLHLLSGESRWMYAILAVHALLAVGMLCGYRTRWCTFLVWLLCVSLFARNDMVTHRADTLLCVMLFWGMFVPWGDRWSIDSRQRPSTQPGRILSIGTAAIVLQMPLAYVFSGLLKFEDASWHTDFSAVYYSMSPEYVTPLGAKISAWLTYPTTQSLTIATLVIEIAAPIALFLPGCWLVQRVFRIPFDCHDWLRIGVFVLLAAFQGILHFAMEVGLFSVISIAALLPVLPGRFWELWKPTATNQEDLTRTSLQPTGTSHPRAGRVVAVAASIVCAAAMSLTFASNLHSVGAVSLDRELRNVARALRLHQNWRMFVRPYKRSGYIVIVGTLDDDHEINLFNGLGRYAGDADDGATFAAPEMPLAGHHYANYRWRLYFQRLRQGGYNDHRLHYSRYLCRQWNGGDQERLMMIKMYFVEVTRDRMGEDHAEPVQRRLSTFWCFGRPRSD